MCVIIFSLIFLMTFVYLCTSSEKGAFKLNALLILSLLHVPDNLHTIQILLLLFAIKYLLDYDKKVVVFGYKHSCDVTAREQLPSLD